MLRGSCDKRLLNRPSASPCSSSSSWSSSRQVAAAGFAYS